MKANSAQKKIMGCGCLMLVGSAVIFMVFVVVASIWGVIS